MPAVKKIMEFNAEGQTLGRLASQVASALRGKTAVSFRPNQNPHQLVKVVKVELARFTGSKLTTKKYWHYSGYPGGMKVTTLSEKFKKDPEGLFRRMVKMMLPKNKLAGQLIRNLTIATTKK